ncbi:MAG: putative phage abortive infection protein [Cyclobacteriaceae bacterium]
MDFKLPHWFYYALLLFGLSLILAPYLFTQPWFPEYSFSLKDGAIGDTIGGITAPFIGFFGVVLTFLAFYVQFEANKQLRKDIERDRFETKFYELLRLHKDNVNEIEIANKHFGRKAFIMMYLEFKFIYFVIDEEKIIWDTDDSRKALVKNIDIDKQLNLAYTLFFYGVSRGPVKQNQLPPHNVSTSFLTKCIKKLKEIRDKQFGSKKTNNNGDGYSILKVNDDPESYNLMVDYFPFDGYSAKLGHYFRHLYQLLKFVVLTTFDRDIKKDKQVKYSYIKTVRAQLSNHEQTMIYYNSFFSAGQIWWGDDKIVERNEDGTLISYFLDWAIVKNTPDHLADIGITPSEKFIEKMNNRNYSEEKIIKDLAWLLESEEG